MSVTPIAVLEGGEYRVAQTDHGGPFIQFLDEKTKLWVAVRLQPGRMGDLESLLAKYASKARLAESALAKMKRELASYKGGFENRGLQLRELQQTNEHLASLAGE
jgi:hypothetical protein